MSLSISEEMQIQKEKNRIRLRIIKIILELILRCFIFALTYTAIFLKTHDWIIAFLAAWYLGYIVDIRDSLAEISKTKTI